MQRNPPLRCGPERESRGISAQFLLHVYPLRCVLVGPFDFEAYADFAILPA